MRIALLILLFVPAAVVLVGGCLQAPKEDTATQTIATADTGGETTAPAADSTRESKGRDTETTSNQAEDEGSASVIENMFSQREAIESELELLRADPNADTGRIKELEGQLASIEDTGAVMMAEAAIKLFGQPYAGPKRPIEELRSELSEIWQVEFTTSFGNFTMEVYPELAPIHGVRFLELVDAGFYNKMHIPRIAPGWVVQWGELRDLMNTANLRPDEEPPVFSCYEDHTQLVVSLKDELPMFSNEQWTVSFAKGGPNTADTQPFINLGNNSKLDDYDPPFSPFAYVVDGRDSIERLVAAFGPAMDAAKADLRAELEAQGAPEDFIQQYLANDLSWGPYVADHWNPFRQALIDKAEIVKRPDVAAQ
jgi:cyclophilin family peptidyl-prolyl cis-trans isomerase